MSPSAYQIGDYSTTFREFRLKAPSHFNWAFEVFDRFAHDPKKLAMIWVGSDGAERRITYAQLANRSRRLANALMELGTSPGDRVFIMLPRIVEWWETMLACIRSRLVAVPATTMLSAHDVGYRLRKSEARIAITDSDNRNKIETVREECPELEYIVVVNGDGPNTDYETLLKAGSSSLENPKNPSDDPLLLYFTSGTTGDPKMVLHTHASYPLGHRITGKFWLDNGPNDLHWTMSDTGWAQAAWTAFFAPWNMGAAIFVFDQRERFDPTRTLDLLEEYPVTTFFATPTAYRMLVFEDLNNWNPQALRLCLGAGEPLNPEVVEAWRQGTGFQIWEGYGQTETVLLAATFPGMEYRPGSMGVAAPGHTLGVLDSELCEVNTGEEGELAVRTQPKRPVGLFPGYWSAPEANKRCFQDDWYLTGDRVKRDSDGYLWFVGRDDDIIISSSYRIGPFEVESALIGHAAVVEAAVVGVPDTLRGQAVKAFVVTAPGWEKTDQLRSELQEFVKQVTAPYKYPRIIEFIDALPKTISGKIRRSELRESE